jgi:hypothetical protein
MVSRAAPARARSAGRDAGPALQAFGVALAARCRRAAWCQGVPARAGARGSAASCASRPPQSGSPGPPRLGRHISNHAQPCHGPASATAQVQFHSIRRSIVHICKDLPLQSCSACSLLVREPAGGQTGASAGCRAPGPAACAGQEAGTRHRAARRTGRRTGPLGRLRPRVPQHDHARAGARGGALRASGQGRLQSTGRAASHHGGMYDHCLRYEHRVSQAAPARSAWPGMRTMAPRCTASTPRPAAPPAAAPRPRPARLPRRTVAHARRDCARKLEIRVLPAAAALARRRRAVRRGRARVRQAGRNGGRQVVILVAAAGRRRRRARAQRDQRAGLRNACLK